MVEPLEWSLGQNTYVSLQTLTAETQGVTGQFGTAVFQSNSVDSCG
jgi:hypothetical protein